MIWLNHVGLIFSRFEWHPKLVSAEGVLSSACLQATLCGSLCEWMFLSEEPRLGWRRFVSCEDLSVVLQWRGPSERGFVNSESLHMRAAAVGSHQAASSFHWRLRSRRLLASRRDLLLVSRNV